MAGRPTALTEQRAEVILALARLPIPVKRIAVRAGIDPSTFFGWQRRAKVGDEPYASFFHRFYEARGEVEDRLTGALSEDGDWRAKAWILERSYQYHRPSAVEVSGPNGGPMQVNVSGDVVRQAIAQLRAEGELTPEELAALEDEDGG